MEKPDVIFAIGTNMTECHPVAALRLKKAIKNGAKMIVADPRRIPLAQMADLHLPIRVGSDVPLILAMCHVIHREGLVDAEFVAERTRESEAFFAHIQRFTPQWAAGICQVPAADIEQAAKWYGAAARGAVFYTLGITEHVCGVDNVQSLCNLVLMTGNFGREGVGLNPMRGQNNVQGSGDNGAVPANFPGFQSVVLPESQAKFEKLYGVKVDMVVGKTKITALNQAGDITRAMLIAGENTVVSDADRRHGEAQLKKLDHLVVVDLFMTETAELAHVVLPATAWGETDGSCVNTERRVQRLRAAVPAQGEAKPDWWILAEIAKRCGIPGFDYESAADVFNEMCQVAPIYNGLDWDRIANSEYCWPVPEKDHPGTSILHVGEFKNGRGIFKTIEYRPPAEMVSDAYPLWLTTGRRLEAYHTRTQTGRAAGIEYLLSEETLEVHPEDLQRLGYVDGQTIEMSSSRGSVEIKIEASTQSQPGTVFCSFSFNDVPVNFLTGHGYDPITETAEFKVCPVNLRAVVATETPAGVPSR
jgi:predicted molibdopterin-dependent oxidoreductase YjgC